MRHLHIPSFIKKNGLIVGMALSMIGCSLSGSYYNKKHLSVRDVIRAEQLYTKGKYKKVIHKYSHILTLQVIKEELIYADLCMFIGMAYLQLEAYEAALATLNKGLYFRKKNLPSHDFQLASTYSYVAQAMQHALFEAPDLFDTSDPATSLQTGILTYFQKARTILLKKKPLPETSLFFSLVTTYVDITKFHLHMKAYEKAIQNQQALIQYLITTLPVEKHQTDPLLGNAYGLLGCTYAQYAKHTNSNNPKDYQAGISWLEKSLTIKKQYEPEEDDFPSQATVLRKLVRLYGNAANPNKSAYATMIGHAEELLAWDQQTLGPDSKQVAHDYRTLGNFHFASKNYREAIEAYEKSYQCYEVLGKKWLHNLAGVADSISSAYHHQAKHTTDKQAQVAYIQKMNFYIDQAQAIRKKKDYSQLLSLQQKCIQSGIGIPPPPACPPPTQASSSLLASMKHSLASGLSSASLTLAYTLLSLISYKSKKR